MLNYYGIYIRFGSDNNTVTDNNCSNNHDGICLESDKNNDNTITSNMLHGNNQYGILLKDGSDNEIHNNCFITNSGQARDDGTDNDWDGNYWSDYTGTPSYYLIPYGSAVSQDNNPLGYCPLKGEPPCGVGGEVLPVGTLELLAPYITAALAVTALLGLAVIGIRRRNT